MKSTEIEFNGEELVASVESLARHLAGGRKLTLRSTTLVFPVPVKAIKPQEIKSIRSVFQSMTSKVG